MDLPGMMDTPTRPLPSLPNSPRAVADATSVAGPWSSSGDPHADYEALLTLFQRGLGLRRQGQNADDFARQQLGNVGVKNMRDLSSLLAYVARRGGEDVPRATPAASAGAAAIDAPSMGMGTQMSGLAEAVRRMSLTPPGTKPTDSATPGDLIQQMLGQGKAGYKTGVRDYQRDAGSLYSDNPMASTAGGVAGSVAGGLLLPAGELLDADLASPLRAGAQAGQAGEGAVVPGIARGLGTGAAVGGVSSLLHQDLTNPDWKTVGKDAAVGGATGTALGSMATAYRSLWNPAQFYLNRALSFDEPLIEESLAQTHPAGEPLMIERSPTLASNAQALARVNRPAAFRAVKALDAEAAKVGANGSEIANDPKTGYDAIFADKTLDDPATLAAWKDLTGSDTPPTAREVFNRYKSMRRFTQNVETARARGTTVVRPEDDQLAVDYHKKMDVFADALSDIPGFDQLQQQVMPFLQRRAALGRLRTLLSRQARGQLGEEPAHGLVKALMQEAGFSTQEAKWRAGGDLLDALTTPTTAKTTAQMRGLLNPSVPFPFQTGRLPGSVPAAAGLLSGAPAGSDQ